MLFGTLTIAIGGFVLFFVSWVAQLLVSMVKDHWSNDGMVSTELRNVTDMADISVKTNWKVETKEVSEVSRNM